MEELARLVQEMNGKPDQKPTTWQALKQKLLEAVLLPAKIMSDVVDENIAEDKAMIADIKAELAREDATSHANQHECPQQA